MVLCYAHRSVMHFDCRILNCVCCCFSLQPKVVTDTEELELAKHLEKLEQANAEVAGDDDNEEEITGMGNDTE